MKNLGPRIPAVSCGRRSTFIQHVFWNLSLGESTKLYEYMASLAARWAAFRNTEYIHLWFWRSHRAGRYIGCIPQCLEICKQNYSIRRHETKLLSFASFCETSWGHSSRIIVNPMRFPGIGTLWCSTLWQANATLSDGKKHKTCFNKRELHENHKDLSPKRLTPSFLSLQDSVGAFCRALVLVALAAHAQIKVFQQTCLNTAPTGSENI